MKLAYIETIREVRNHPNADKLDLAKVLGWQVIVKRDEYKEGDKVVFIATDTILPSAPWSDFLKSKSSPDKPIRLNTIKLRGEYSSGLVLPLSILPEELRGSASDVDLGEALGVKKYVKEMPAQLQGVAKSNFPTHAAVKTDEDNGLTEIDFARGMLAECGFNGVTATKKLDGSSITVIVENGVIQHVCSRNLSLIEGDSAFWIAARKLRLDGFTGVIQGELMGPRIQRNQLELTEPEMFAFQITRRDGSFMTYLEMLDTADDLGVKEVPLADVPSNPNTPSTVEEWQEIADAQTLTVNGKTVPCEGIVIRPNSYEANHRGRPKGFKLINRTYKDE